MLRFICWPIVAVFLMLSSMQALGAAQQGSTGVPQLIFAAIHNGQTNIYRIKVDGSARSLLIKNGAEPAVSPNGRQLAFVRGRDIFLANSDGSGQRALTHHGLGVQVHHPAFSADNLRLVFARAPVVPNPVYHICLVNVDGSQERSVANNGLDPVYAPDGVSIIFARGGDIMSMVTNNMGGNAYVPGVLLSHGAGVFVRTPSYSPASGSIIFAIAPVVPHPVSNIDVMTFNDPNRESRLVHNGSAPAYSPDGHRVAFARDGSLYLINSDGSKLTQLTHGPADSHPVWVSAH